MSNQKKNIMSNILLTNPVTSYSRAELDHICELNADMEIEYVTVEKLSYLKIRNFLKRPLELRDFLFLNFQLKTVIEVWWKEPIRKIEVLLLDFSK